MAQGKDAALDLRYGRQGGYRSHATERGEAVIAELDRLRRQHLAAGTWPDGRPHGDQACRVCGATYDDHTGELCPYCRRPVEHCPPADRDLERAGKRRAADARHAAGSPLDDLDRELLAS